MKKTPFVTKIPSQVKFPFQIFSVISVKIVENLFLKKNREFIQTNFII